MLRADNGLYLVIVCRSEMMREGAFALIDCLGWKGIWHGTSEIALIEKVSRIQAEVEEEVKKINLQHLNTSSGPIVAQIRLISDTVAVSIQHENDSPPIDSLKKAYLVRTAALSVARIQKLFLAEEPRVALRGCVSYGNHVVVNNFIIGPAVDEAADYYESADGAMVWVLPSAGIHSNCGDVLLHDIGSLLILYNMPLKGGGQLKSLLINPLYLEASADRRRAIISGFLEAMRRVERLDVWVKGQNTLDFLEEAESATAHFEEKINSPTWLPVPQSDLTERIEK